MNKKHDLSIFIGLLTIFTSFSFYICSNLILKSFNIDLHISKMFLLVTGLGWFSFSISEHSNSRNLLTFFIKCTLYCLPIFLMSILNLSFLFWIVLIVSLYYPVIATYKYYEQTWDALISSAYLIWFVTCTLITIGNNSFLHYSDSIIKLSKINTLLNIKFFTFSIFAILLLIKSTITALRDQNFTIKPMPIPQLPKASEDIKKTVYLVIQPLIATLNILLQGFFNIVEIIWQLIATGAIYLGRIGNNIASIIHDLLQKKHLWWSIFKIIGTFLAILFFAKLVNITSENVLSYLRSPDPFYSIKIGTISNLSYTILLYLVTLLGILLVDYLWKFNSNARDKAIFYGVMLLIELSLSGAIMYFLANINRLEIIGFNHIGLFSFIICLIVSIVILYQIFIGSNNYTTESERG